MIIEAADNLGVYIFFVWLICDIRKIERRGGEFQHPQRHVPLQGEIFALLDVLNSRGETPPVFETGALPGWATSALIALLVRI
jgi:hypothetical protein